MTTRTVTVHDDTNPGIVATLTYAPDLVSVAVSVRDNRPALTPSVLRDLPLTRYAEAAAAAMWYSDEVYLHVRLGIDAGPDPDEVERVARQRALALEPGLDDDTTPAGRRHARTIHHLAHVAVEHEMHQRAGRRDPAVLIARTHGVAPATARSWVLRARTAGLLPASPRPRAAARTR